MLVEQAKKIGNLLPATFRNTTFLRMFTFWKIPLIFWVSPVVEELSETTTRVRIPLNRRTKNHLKSMYFGVLCTGADCAGGLAAMKYIFESGVEVSLAFKEFKAQFLKRAEADVVFECHQGIEIKEFVKRVLASDERHNFPVIIKAYCPSLPEANLPVAEFELMLSLKRKSKTKN